MKKQITTNNTASRRLTVADLSIVKGALELRKPILKSGEWETTTGDGRLGDGGVRDCD